MEDIEKKQYEAPELEIIEFSIKDSIPASGANGAAYWEEI